MHNLMKLNEFELNLSEKVNRKYFKVKYLNLKHLNKKTDSKKKESKK